MTEYPDDNYVLHECKCNCTTALKVDSLPEYLDYPVPKIMIAGDYEKLVKVRAEILEKYSDHLVSAFAESFFLDVSVVGVGKDKALENVCNYLNITKDELMVCGDGLNDVPMFDYAGFSVAMKNAYPEAAARATVIAPKTNDECGVAYAIEKYILHD